MSIAGAFAADKDDTFHAPPAASLAHHQTNEQITIGVDAYMGGEKVKLAFGKLDPSLYGVLPVLVVIQNDYAKTLQLDRLVVQFAGSTGGKVDSTPARDVKYIRGPDRPRAINGPGGGTVILKGKKNPLDTWEIEGRAFAAKMLAPGKSASGFFYFQGDLQPGATVLINGLVEAATGKELFYFEVPLK